MTSLTPRDPYIFWPIITGYFIGNVYTLVYGEFTHALLGRYTCQASNQKGTVTTSCVVTEGGYSDDDLEQYPTAKVSITLTPLPLKIMLRNSLWWKKLCQITSKNTCNAGGKSMHEFCEKCAFWNSATFTCLNNADFLMIILHGHIVHTPTKVHAKCNLSAKMCSWGWEFRMKGRALFSGRELRSGERRKIKKWRYFFDLVLDARVIWLAVERPRSGPIGEWF